MAISLSMMKWKNGLLSSKWDRINYNGKIFTPQSNTENVEVAEKKINNAVRDMKNGKLPQEGIGLLYQFAGLFGQRLYFYNMRTSDHI